MTSSQVSAAEDINSPVFFWRETERPYGCFSQWYLQAFTETNGSGDSVTFETAEQYMMYHKALLFHDHDIAAQILNAKGGRKQRALGRRVRDFDDDIWAANRSRIVRNGNIHKFSQNAELSQTLLGTGDREIVEASPRDRIWGVGYGAGNALAKRENWGLNLLGKTLMEVRKQIREEEQWREEKE